MKLRTLTLCIAAALALTLCASAADIVDSGKCGANVTYTLDSDGVLTISGKGRMYDWEYFDSPFFASQNLTAIVIQNGVTSIGKSAFLNCHMTSVTIPNSVTSIGADAISFCPHLTSVTIPDSVTSIGAAAFAACAELTAIFVDADNSNYASLDGVLFDKNCTTLMCYPGGRAGAYAIPDSVTSIDAMAFDSCASLTNVTIPDGVPSIGWRAFYACGSLISVTIPDSVTSIDSIAFRDCASLTDVYYRGSATQWSEICFYGDNSALKNATIHYNAKDIGIGITLTDKNGKTVDANGQTGETEETKKDAFQGGAEFQAQFDALNPDAVKSSELFTASVFVIFYDKDGLMLSLQQWEINLSDLLNIFFTQIVSVPEGAKTLKFLMLGDNLEPLRAARMIESSAA